jgi:hypothetical protein
LQNVAFFSGKPVCCILPTQFSCCVVRFPFSVEAASAAAVAVAAAAATRMKKDGSGDCYYTTRTDEEGILGLFWTTAFAVPSKIRVTF